MFVCVFVCVCVCVCEREREGRVSECARACVYVLRIVSTDTILPFINTLTIIFNVRVCP